MLQILPIALTQVNSERETSNKTKPRKGDEQFSNESDEFKDAENVSEKVVYLFHRLALLNNKAVI